jgi:hypothetical protein
MRPNRGSVLRALLLTTAFVALARTASADATLFIGNTATPSSRQVKGFAVGAGLLVVGVEFEYANTSEDTEEAAPRLRTGMGNLLVQTPFAIAGVQPYFTTGGGAYRETLGTRQETSFGFNTGGGVKVSLLGTCPRAPRLPCVQAARRSAARRGAQDLRGGQSQVLNYFPGTFGLVSTVGGGAVGVCDGAVCGRGVVVPGRSDPVERSSASAA